MDPVALWFEISEFRLTSCPINYLHGVVRSALSSTTLSFEQKEVWRRLSLELAPVVSRF